MDTDLEREDEDRPQEPEASPESEVASDGAPDAVAQADADSLEPAAVPPAAVPGPAVPGALVPAPDGAEPWSEAAWGEPTGGTPSTGRPSTGGGSPTASGPAASTTPTTPTTPMADVFSSTWLHVLALVAACFLVYSNAYEHAFNLDSTHVAADNPAIRSLANFERFFTDPGTFSSLRPNVDYRPVLVVSYALDYAIAEYDMAQWHLTQILLHAACVLGLYALCRTLLTRLEGGSGFATRTLALVAAAIFAVHPTNAGVVDYISARSSLLTAAFLLPAIVLYVRPRGVRAQRTMWGAAILYSLAVFTKVEAIGCLGVFLAFEVWQTARRSGGTRSFLGDLVATFVRGGFAPGVVRDFGATLWRGWLRRMWPMLAVTAAYWIQVRTPLMADFNYDQASRLSDVTPLQYFLTQLSAWWHYVARWFLAAEFVADDQTFAIDRTLLSPRALLAAGAWLAVAAYLLGSWRRRPELTFLAIAALAMLFPTSSFRPLSEMVNEHRPYLPLALLSLVWMIPLGRAVIRHWPTDPLPFLLGLAGVGALVTGLGQVAHQRNLVFQTPESYWRDVLDKAPRERAHVNYGLTLMQRDDLAGALEHFEAALETAPRWHITHTNLAIVHRSLGQPVKAREHFDRAVEYDEFSGTARTWRGEHLLTLGLWAEASLDFERSLPLSLENYRNHRGLATARAGLADAAGCHAALRELLALDPEAVGRDIVAISTPFFTDESRLAAGLEFFQLLEGDLPDTWWVHENIATLARRLGRTDLADQAAASSRRLKPE